MNSDITERPYPGLRPFRSEESDIFFGREEHTDQLLEKLGDTRFISVVGLSGCGKSSLVRAGMIAALKSGYLAEAGTRWRIAEMRPGAHPLSSLAHALLAEKKLADELACLFSQFTQATAELHSVLLTSLQSGAFSLVEIWRRLNLPANTNLLLLVDQFEEIFRFHDKNDAETEAFVKLLLASANQQDVPIYIVITMRSDFIGHCARFYDLPEMMNRGQFLVPRLSREQQEMAIVGPAGVFGGEIEPDLVNALLDEMGNDPDQLPLLQHCLMRMWTRKISEILETPKVLLTIDDYEAVGGLKNALSNHADEAYAELNDRQKQIAETMFRLLTEGDRRRPTALKEVANLAGVSEIEVEDVTKIFRHSDRCFLLPSSDIPLTPDAILDISHESLIRQWDTLQMWVEKETDAAEIYKRLEKTAILWRHEKAGLWNTPDLENALSWRETKKPTLQWAQRYGENFETAIEFLEASVRAQKQKQLQKEQARRKEFIRKFVYAGTVIASIAAVISIILASWALQERLKVKQLNNDLARSLDKVKQLNNYLEMSLDTVRKNTAILEQDLFDQLNDIVLISQRIQEKENVIQREDSKKFAEASLGLPYIEETVTDTLAETLESGDVSFDREQYELTDRAKQDIQAGLLQQFLTKLDNFMNRYPDRHFMIHIKTVGYTDLTELSELATKRILDTIPEGTAIPDADPERRIFLNRRLSELRAQSLYEYLSNSVSGALQDNYKNIQFAPPIFIGKGEEIPPNIFSPYPDNDSRRRICRIFSYITTQQEIFRVGQIVIQDTEKIEIVSDYRVKTNQRISLAVELTNPAQHDIEITWTAENGKIPSISESANIYTAPAEPGKDQIVVYIWDKNSDETIEKTINIEVIP